jgi:hypothetical protein
VPLEGRLLGILQLALNLGLYLSGDLIELLRGAHEATVRAAVLSTY